MQASPQDKQSNKQESHVGIRAEQIMEMEIKYMHTKLPKNRNVTPIYFFIWRGPHKVNPKE